MGRRGRGPGRGPRWVGGCRRRRRARRRNGRPEAAAAATLQAPRLRPQPWLVRRPVPGRRGPSAAPPARPPPRAAYERGGRHARGAVRHRRAARRPSRASAHFGAWYWMLGSPSPSWVVWTRAGAAISAGTGASSAALGAPRVRGAPGECSWSSRESSGAGARGVSRGARRLGLEQQRHAPHSRAGPRAGCHSYFLRNWGVWGPDGSLGPTPRDAHWAPGGRAPTLGGGASRVRL